MRQPLPPGMPTKSGHTRSRYFSGRMDKHIYLLFSRAGFTGSLKRYQAEDSGLWLLSPMEILGEE